MLKTVLKRVAVEALVERVRRKVNAKRQGSQDQASRSRSGDWEESEDIGQPSPEEVRRHYRGSVQTAEAVMRTSLQNLISAVAGKHGVPEGIVRGLIEAESGWNPWAMRYESHYRWLYCPRKQRPDANPSPLPGCSRDTEREAQKTSWGLLQIMGAAARERGFRGVFLSELCDPEVGLEYGLMHLNWMRKRFYDKGGWPAVISAYNAGTPTGSNRAYVDKVLKYWR